MASLHTTTLLFALLVFVLHANGDTILDRRGVPSDIPYIKCETCNHIARAATNATNQLLFDQLTEIQTFDIVEQLCDPSTNQGNWACKIDMVEHVRKIRLEVQQNPQPCKQECKTLSLACASIMDGIESELAEQLYAWRKKGIVSESQVVSWLCDKRKGASRACEHATPLFEKARPTGPPFKVADEKELLEMQMKEFAEQSGQGMNMFNADQLKDMKPDDDDDDIDYAGGDEL